MADIDSLERATKIANEFGSSPGGAFDLKTGWDSSKAHVRKQAWGKIWKDRPALIIGSPPCTDFSIVQKMNARRSQESEEKWHAAVEQVKICVRIYLRQTGKGRHLLHEHLAHAQSWQLPIRRVLAQDTRVTEVCADTRAFGLKTVGPQVRSARLGNPRSS